MTKKLGCTTLAALMLASSPLMAMTDQEIEARFKQYEARIKALESDLANKPSPVYEQNLAKSPSPVSTQSVGDGKLKINGFITAAATIAEEDVNRFNTSDTVNFRGLSKAGVQLTYQLNDKADATIQMVARSDDENGTDTWELNAEWAYLGYQLTDNLKLRAGRMRIPFYMYSESLDVGYSYPWARPPLSVYRSPLTAYDGVDLTYNFATGSIGHTTQFWSGSYADTSNGPAGIPDDLELKDQYGLNHTSTWGDFTARAMIFTITIDGTTTVDVGGGAPVIYAQFPAEDKLDYSALGFQWDNGQYFVITETTDLRSQKGLFFTDEKGGYISAGTRIKDWTPYATYGWAYTANEGDFVGAFDGATVCGGPAYIGGANNNKSCSSQSKNISLGLRKELDANLSFTMQWDHYYDFGGTNGYWGFADYSSTGGVPFPPGGAPLATSNGEGWNNADVYTLSLDAVF